MPDAKIRSSILAIHLSNRKQPLANFDIDGLAEAMQGFSGAEIEQAIVSALYAAHAKGQPLSNAHILEEIRHTRPLSVVMREKIEAMRDWAGGRTVPCD